MDVEALFDATTAGDGQAPGQLRILAQSLERLSERRRVSRLDEQSRHARLDQLRNTGDPARDHGSLGRERFHQGHGDAVRTSVVEHAPG